MSQMGKSRLPRLLSIPRDFMEEVFVSRFLCFIFVVVVDQVQVWVGCDT
jgi:hypothetical protein